MSGTVSLYDFLFSLHGITFASFLSRISFESFAAIFPQWPAHESIRRIPTFLRTDCHLGPHARSWRGVSTCRHHIVFCRLSPQRQRQTQNCTPYLHIHIRISISSWTGQKPTKRDGPNTPPISGLATSDAITIGLASVVLSLPWHHPGRPGHLASLYDADRTKSPRRNDQGTPLWM